jgi:hypothetical protein
LTRKAVGVSLCVFSCRSRGWVCLSQTQTPLLKRQDEFHYSSLGRAPPAWPHRRSKSVLQDRLNKKCLTKVAVLSYPLPSPGSCQSPSQLLGSRSVTIPAILTPVNNSSRLFWHWLGTICLFWWKKGEREREWDRETEIGMIEKYK